MKPVVIIGSGLAGYTLAKTLRGLDKDIPITIVTADDGAVYSKPMLSNALASNKSAMALVTADADKMATDLNLNIQHHTRVMCIDAGARKLELDSGESLAYGKLVLATGANPIRLPIEGNAAAEILSVNNRDDYAHFRDMIADKKHIAILGPGLIGCEFANDLVSAGYQVSVIGPDQAPLGRLVPVQIGEALKTALSSKGVNWYLQTTVASVDRPDGSPANDLSLSLSNGETIQADVVLSAIGLRAATGLAQTAGIQTSRGIVVDRYMQTSVEDIYAVGDCAEVDGQCLPFVLPLMQGARALAKTLSGSPTAVSYPAMPVIVKTPACPVVVVPPPPSLSAEGQWQIESPDKEAAETDGSENVRACFYDQQGQLHGFALSGSSVSEKAALLKQLPASA
ncbi:MAG: FAD-dependent oxidoreductase [Gammaproteobacteria bacterium]|nr:FAD-dependent oxidoreductase [Gammaproteobacteria bacterium]